MKSLYLQFSEPSKRMRVGERYVLSFGTSGQKPGDDDCVKLHAVENLYLRIDGIDGSWTEEELTRPLPLTDSQFSIEIKPPLDLNKERIQLRASVTLGELGGALVDIYDQEVLISGATQAAAGLMPAHQTGEPSIELSRKLETLLQITAQPIPNYGALYATVNGSGLTFLAQRSGGETKISREPLDLKNMEQMALDSFIRIQGQVSFNDLSGLGKNLYHELDPNILDWLSNLLQTRTQGASDGPAAGQFPALLIFDNTHAEIPWELIYFEPAVEEGLRGFLGTLAAVSRWKPLKKEGLSVMPEIVETQRDGRLVSYAPRVPGFLTNVDEEIRAVSTCGGLSLQSGEELCRTLCEQHDDVALLHIASHGTFQVDQPVAASLRTPGDEITALSLTHLNMKLLARSKPVVFINACHSAREGQLGWSVSGLQVPFLRQGAKGLIGVMGRVRSKSAALIAKRLFQEMLEERPRSVAEILRQMRVEAARKLQNLSPEEQKFFLDTFMYVFYGSPFKTVRIVRHGAGGAER